MPEILWARGGYATNIVGLGGVCRNFCELRGGYAGTFVGSRRGYAGTIVGLGGVMPELLKAWGGYAGTFVGLRGGMPELL